MVVPAGYYLLLAAGLFTIGLVGLMVRRSIIVMFMCVCLLYTSPSPRDKRQSRMPSSA